ncbi:diacylglycerol lipase-alpha-like [Lytechinus pictus]|uniref:diacylglycerol lipase-alpha-like n=1 Tax=Lytechinus pictus TaxID=7653 RepID=UPI0030BA0B64
MGAQRTRAKYEQNWDKRLRFWFCCTSSGETQDSAFSDIAILFSEFFRDLDVVPTDVLAGLMLLREEQKQRRRAIENSPQNSVFKFLSGVAVTPETKFLDFHKSEDMDLFEELHYYFKFAAASYGWKGYVMVYGAEGCCTMTRECRCCCFKRRRHYHLDETSDPDADNCCMCNFAALKKMSGLSNNDIIYATFHVSVSSNKEDSSVTESYGLDTEGLVLVGRTNEKGGLKRDVPNSRGDKTPLDAETPESGICLTTSLSFQEEMDDRMMTFDAGSLGSSDVFDDGLLSCGGRFCSCLPPSLSPCSQACCDSDVLSAGSVSSLSQSENLVWETPFFVALDHERRRVVVSIRGTLSVADIVTDLSADTSPISSQDESSPYQGHKGMVEAANYIKRRLIDDMLLHQAFTSDEARGTQNYELLLVGHSLGAGTAAILGIMLRPDYPTLKVYAYSPPGGLLCKESSEYAAEFVTSLVVGKDVVARIGLSQMEFLRADLLNCIKMCRDPKWRVIMGELLCCCTVHSKNLAPVEDVDTPSPFPCRLDKAFHPTNHALVLSTHSPLYLPGRVLQIVRNNHKREGISKKDCAYYGIWRDLEDFSEVLISPVIIKDHLPGGVMTALDKCMEYGKRHGLPKRWSQVGRAPMSPPSPSQEFNQPPSSSSSHSSYLQMKPARSTREGTHTVHFQDSPSKSSGSSNKSSPTRGWGNKASESNNNLLPSGLPSTPEEQVPFLPQSSEQSIPDDKLRTNSQNEWPKTTLTNLASNFSSEGAAVHERLAPLASSESYTETESARSSISSTSYSSVLNRFETSPTTKDEGYCYYVTNESESTVNNNTEDSGDDSEKPNAIRTTATIESMPCNHDNKVEAPVKTSPPLVGPWSLFRGGNSHMFDEEGNVKGRTSADDRYTLTYDGMDLDPNTGSEGGTDSPLSSRPQSNVGTSATQPYLPEAKLGHGYTEYLPVSPDADDDIDDEALFASLRPGLYENHSEKSRKSYTLPIGSSLPPYGDDLGVKGGSPGVIPRRRRSLDTVSSSTLTSGSSHSSPQRQVEAKTISLDDL